MDRLRQLIREIHRRSLWQVLLIYVGASWAVLQVVDTVAGALQLPDWVEPVALILLIVGLPIVLATAFVQEGVSSQPGQTPEGAGTASSATSLFTWRNAFGAGVLTFALWGVFAAAWLLFSDSSNRTGSVAGSAGASVTVRPSIAVLPFETPTVDQASLTLAEGMHEEVQGRLSKIHGLRLITRSAVLAYERTGQPLSEIADGLGVTHLVTGTVSRAADRLRVSVSLIAPSTGEGLWSESYEQQYSPESIFDIWTDVAEQVARALDTQLSLEEQRRVAVRATASDEAYELYLSALGSPSREAVEQLEAATEIDSAFVDAWARIAATTIQTWWLAPALRTDEWLDRGLHALARAEELDPTNVTYLHAMGLYQYYVLEDFERALDFFEAEVDADPNSAGGWLFVGHMARRLGDFDRALSAYRTCESLGGTSCEGNLSATLGYVRRWEEANTVGRRARLADGGLSSRWPVRGGLPYLQGDIGGARRENREYLESGGAFSSVAQYRLAWSYVAERDYEQALGRVRSIETEVIDRGEMGYEPKDYLLARIHDFAGRTDEARSLYEAARTQLEGWLEEEPDNAPARSTLGIVSAALGDREAAVREGQRAMDLVPLDHDAWLATLHMEDMARIHVELGEAGQALEMIEDLLARPSWLTQARLLMEPDWDPLRQDPRFRALVAD